MGHIEQHSFVIFMIECMRFFDTKEKEREKKRKGTLNSIHLSFLWLNVCVFFGRERRELEKGIPDWIIFWWKCQPGLVACHECVMFSCAWACVAKGGKCLMPSQRRIPAGLADTSGRHQVVPWGQFVHTVLALGESARWQRKLSSFLDVKSTRHLKHKLLHLECSC